MYQIKCSDFCNLKIYLAYEQLGSSFLSLCGFLCFRPRLVTTHTVILFAPQAVQLTKFDYRLSNKLDTDLQKLRCRVNYHALRFTDPIVELGIKLVDRMRMRSKHFIALHLR